MTTEPHIATHVTIVPNRCGFEQTSDKKHQTILVVDDDVSIVKFVEFILVRHGYRVQIARNGQKALLQMEKDPPDLILLDCVMPGIDGFELCRRIRENSDYDDVPVIFITAKTDSQDIAKGFLIGGADYVTKPIDHIQLMARINTQIELAVARRQLRQRAAELESIVGKQTIRLDQVRDGQQQLLVDPAAVAGIQTAVRFQAAYEAGGDFYDIVRLGEDVYGFLVADVSGHDLGTAYLTGALKALTASFTNETLSVTETFFMLNNSLNKFLDPIQYATACYVKYSPSRRELKLISAGHPGPLIQTIDGDVQYTEIVGDVLGMYDIIRCETREIIVQPGERLYLYTDGLIEGLKDSEGKIQNRQWGIEALRKKLIAKQSDPLQITVDSIVDELIEEYSGVVGDDILLMGIEF